jgi:hypothetical protein
METQEREKTSAHRSGIIVLPFLILAGLFIAPPTRALLQEQLRLIHNISPFLARLREMRVREGPPIPAPTWKGSPTAATVARFPEDYAIQLGGALLEESYTDSVNPVSPQESFSRYQRSYGERLAALSARFPDRPGPYAHALRFMTSAAVRVSREAEVENFWTGKTPYALVDRQVGYAESWAAFDHAAAQGERLDPDNAYFPMMRALWLFDAKRDSEGIAAVLRAGQKSRFEDYIMEEPDAEWALYQRAYGPTSVLIHQSIDAAALWPHFAALRSLARLTAYQARKLELAGRIQDGLALRHAMMQCGVRMREQGHTLGALVGNAIVPIQTNLAVRKPPVTPSPDETVDQRADRIRDRYLAYLHQIGAEQEATWFAQVDASDRQVRSLLQTAVMESPTRSLPGLWMLDMLLLINLSILLLLSTTAIVCARIPGGEKALPIVIIVLLVGCLVVVLPMQWAEALTQMRLVLDNLSMFADEIGAKSDGFNISGFVRQYPFVVHVGEVLLSLIATALTLFTLGLVSLLRRETFAVALPRGLRQSALVVATLLTVAYAGALIVTAQTETQAGVVLDGMNHNAVAYLQQQQTSDRKP